MNAGFIALCCNFLTGVFNQLTLPRFQICVRPPRYCRFGAGAWRTMLPAGRTPLREPVDAVRLSLNLLLVIDQAWCRLDGQESGVQDERTFSNRDEGSAGQAHWHGPYCGKFIFCEQRSRTIGSARDFPTKEAALRAVNPTSTRKPQPTIAGTLRTLVAQYREERMPRRQSTRRGYNIWLDNHILPKWGGSLIVALQARPVELWLHSLPLSAKSKLHIRGVLSILWDYAMWRGDVPTQGNPMELVSIKGASRRMRKPHSLSTEEFHKLMDALGDDVGMRTMLLLSVSFGLRISEVLGLK